MWYGDVPLCLACATDAGGPLHVAYRERLGRWWALTAQGPQADKAEVLAAYNDLLRLTDEVGEPRATNLCR